MSNPFAPSNLATAQYDADASQPSLPNLNYVVQANRLRNTLGNIDPESYVGRVSTLRSPTIATAVLRAFRAAIVGGGGTISDSHLDAILPALDRLIQSGAWAKCREVWIPVGDQLTAALFKLKADSTAGAAMTGISLVAGDYTPNTGITGDGATNAVNTGFNPTTAGVTQTDWGFGAYTTGVTASGIIAGGLVGTGTYLGYSVAQNSNFNQQAAGTQIPMAGWNAIQLTGGVVYKYTGGHVQASQALGAGTLDNTPIVLLSANSSFFSSNAVVGWAAWTPALTATEMRELTIFFSSVNTALWRPVWQPTVVGDGDSNMGGFGLGTPATMRYNRLIANALGMTEDNWGANNTTMSNDENGGASGHWIDVPARLLESSTARAPTILLVALGTNDDRYQVSYNNFITDYEAWLNVQFNAGIDPGQVLLFGLPATRDVLSSAARQVQFSNGVQALAKKYGTDFFDLYGFTVGNSGYFQGDLLHLSQTCHAAIASSVIARLSKLNKPGPLRRIGWT